MAAVVPLVLGLLALVDAGFAGFRAATGRNARIDKRSYYLLAARRGLAGRTMVLGLVALLVAVTLGWSADPDARYDELVRAGTRMLQVVVPFAALVAATAGVLAVEPLVHRRWYRAPA